MFESCLRNTQQRLHRNLVLRCSLFYGPADILRDGYIGIEVLKVTMARDLR